MYHPSNCICHCSDCINRHANFPSSCLQPSHRPFPCRKWPGVRWPWGRGWPLGRGWWDRWEWAKWVWAGPWPWGRCRASWVLARWIWRIWVRSGCATTCRSRCVARCASTRRGWGATRHWTAPTTVARASSAFRRSPNTTSPPRCSRRRPRTWWRPLATVTTWRRANGWRSSSTTWWKRRVQDYLAYI